MTGPPLGGYAELADEFTNIIRASELVWTDDVLDRTEQWVNGKTGGDCDVRTVAAALLSSTIASAQACRSSNPEAERDALVGAVNRGRRAILELARVRGVLEEGLSKAAILRSESVYVWASMAREFIATAKALEEEDLASLTPPKLEARSQAETEGASKLAREWCERQNPGDWLQDDVDDLTAQIRALLQSHQGQKDGASS